MIGQKLKYQRNKAKLTLKDLSERTGLSIGYLSNIERGLTSPTLENLQLICNAMSIDMLAVINSTISFNPCIKKSERKVMFGNESQIFYQMLTGENMKLRGFCQIIPANYDDEVTTWGHEMDECGVVIEGGLFMEIDGVPYSLEPGDSVYLPAHTVHKFKRTSEGDCIIYWFRDNTQYCRINSGTGGQPPQNG